MTVEFPPRLRRFSSRAFLAGSLGSVVQSRSKKPNGISIRVFLLLLLGAAPLLTALLPKRALAQEVRAVDATITEAFKAGKLPLLHAALVISRGETLTEVYFDGQDEQWGRKLGTVHHGPEELHDIRSITKSVVALLYGIALSEGKVPDLDAPLLAQFPRYADLAGDSLRERITVGDALAMRMGTEWNENTPYTDPLNSEIALLKSADPIRFALDKPMVAPPGSRWAYNGGATELIGKLISDGTGMALDDYAREKLFRPLHISRWYWSRRPDGAPSSASGLRLTARDLAKIGQLVLDRGQFDGRPVVPRSWLDTLFTPRTDLEGVRYGYFWWLADSTSPRAWVSGLGNQLPDVASWPAWVGGLGNGGQRLSIQPDIELIVVVFAGDYNNQEDWVMPVKIIEEHVTPELRRRMVK
jgi:CubicO group peptidase (beta-lactamase class C family)